MRLLRLSATAIWLLIMGPAALAQAPPAQEPVSSQQKADIAAAATPEQLVDLAKNYVLQRSFPAAALAVQRAVQLKPEILADSRPQSPRSWHEFWFAQRALLIEQKLPKNNAAGRVTLAKWLYDAGLTSQAAQTLTRALEIDKTHAEANELARKWNLGSGGPIRIDFTYALNQPLFMPTLQDKSVELMIQRNNVFVAVPMAYNTTDTKLNITKPMLKATTDAGKICPVRGIALLKGDIGGTTGPGTGAAVVPKLQWPDASEPFYERIQVQQKADKSGYELACYDQAPPIARRVPPVPGAPRERITPPPRPSISPGGGPPGRETREGSGYVAFIIEAPQDLKSLTLELRGGTPLKVDAVYLHALGITKETPASEREEALNILLSASGAKEGPIAAGAVGKLAMLRFTGSDPSQSTAAALHPATIEKIDRALITATSHPDGPTRQTAFDVTLRGAEPPPEPFLQQLRTFPQPPVLLAMLDTIKQVLAQPRPPEDSAQPGAPPAPPPGTDGMLGADLPASTAPPALFAATTACLAHADATVRQQAVDLLLADGSRESVTAISKATGPARDAVAARLGTLTSAELKAAVVRALLTKADPAATVRVLQAVGPISMVVSREDDPLLTALTAQSSPQALEMLLGLLARANLTAVSGSDKLRQSLDQIASAHQKEAGVRNALLALALGQFKQLPYEAPIKRERSGSLTRTGTAFEAVLAGLAASGTDEKTAQMAALILLQSGRIGLLSERFAQSQPERRKKLIEGLLRDKDLDDREALPIFLAGRLTDPDPGVVQTASSGLSMKQRMEAKRRWRFNLGVKQGVESRQLLEVSVSSDERTATPAANLLAGLAMLSTTEAAEFTSGDRATRDQRLTEADQKRQSKPSGNYVAMVYVDLKPADAPPGAAPIAPPATQPEAPPLPRTSMPLAHAPTTLMPAGNTTRVIVDGSDITVSPAPGAGGAPTGIRINAAMILRGALSSPEAVKEGVADKVDLTPLNEPRECDLKYEQLGTWSCELNIPESTTPVEGQPFKLLGAKIFFEPMPPR